MTLKVRRFDRESQATGPGWIRDQSFTRAKISKHSFDKRVLRLSIERHLTTLVAPLERIVFFHTHWGLP